MTWRALSVRLESQELGLRPELAVQIAPESNTRGSEKIAAAMHSAIAMPEARRIIAESA